MSEQLCHKSAIYIKNYYFLLFSSLTVPIFFIAFSDENGITFCYRIDNLYIKLGFIDIEVFVHGKNK